MKRWWHTNAYIERSMVFLIMLLSITIVACTTLDPVVADDGNTHGACAIIGTITEITITDTHTLLLLLLLSAMLLGSIVPYALVRLPVYSTMPAVYRGTSIRRYCYLSEFFGSGILHPILYDSTQRT